MGYQSKTWSLSDEVVAEIERRVELMTRETGSGSPNRVLKEALFVPYASKTRQFPATASPAMITHDEVTRPLVERTSLDAIGPELSSGRGKASMETFSRGPRQKGDKTR